MDISIEKTDIQGGLNTAADRPPKEFIPSGTFESFLSWDYILRSLETAGIGYWRIMVSEDGAAIFNANGSFISMSGLSTENFPATYDDFISVCVHPDDRWRIPDLFSSPNKAGSNYDFIVRLFNRRSEKWRWVHCRGEVIELDEKRRPRVVFGCIVDVQEAYQSRLDLVQKEAALRLERQRIDAIIDAAGLIIWDWDLKNETVRYGESLYAAKGLSEARPIREPWSEALSQEDQARVLEARQRHLNGESPYYEAEMKIRRPGGATFWAHDKGRVVEWDEEGRPARMMGAAIDISARKAADLALAESHLRLEQLMEAANISVWDWELDSGKLSVTSNYSRLLGHDSSELETLGEKWFDYVHPDDAEPLRRAVECLAEGRKDRLILEYRLKSKDGYLWFYSLLRAVGHDDSGRPSHMIGAQVDFTAKKQLEERQAQAMEVIRLQKAEMEKQLGERSRLIRGAQEQMEELMRSSGARLDPTQKVIKAEMDELFDRISIIDGEPTEVSARYTHLAFKYVSNEMVWYRAILDKLPFPVSVFDLNHRWVYLNQPALEILKVDDGSTMIGRDYQQGWKKFSYHKTISQESAAGQKTFIRQHPESGRYYFCQSSPLNDEAGRNIGFIETMQDITRAHEADSRMRLMLDATPMPSVVFNETGQVLECNLEAVSLCGLSSKKEYLEQFFDCMPPSLPDGTPAASSLLQSVQKAFIRGRAFMDRMYLKDIQGRDMPGEVFLTRVAWGDGYIVLACFRDLRESIAAQKKLDRERLLLKDILEGCPIAFVMSARGRVILTNPFTSKTLGLSVGDNPDKITVRSSELLTINRSFKKGGPINWLPVKIRDVKGEIIEALLNVYATKYDNMPVRVAWLMDVTELKRKEKELEIARDQAEASTRAKSDFMANISHEIRTPMNAIIGLNHLVLQTELSDQQREYVTKGDTASKSLLHLINDILDFSKIEAGKLELNLAEFDLEELLIQAVDLFGPQAFVKGLEFILNVSPELPRRYKGDDFRILQIINNLISNAIKFTSSGQIKLEVELLSKNNESAWLQWKVSDSGIGINPAIIEKLFSAFTQADNSHTRRYGGTGLGLTISKQLVDMMGGAISCQSTPGQGSSFIFTTRLQLADDQNCYLKPYQSFEGLNVLVADDHAASLESIGQSLSALGFAVITADSGAAALQIMKSRAESGQRTDLLLIDHDLPDENGQLVLEKIIKITGPGNLPPAALMIGSGVRHEPLSQNDAALAIIQKPFTASNLVDTLAPILEPGRKRYNVSARYNKRGHDPSELVGHLAGASILLAEDNEVNQLVARKILEKAGLKVTVVENGRLAVDALKSGEKFDLVLMDIQMPVMDGLSAAAEIRQDERFKFLPIVAMTAHAMGEDKEKSLAAGMNDHIIKPLDLNSLFSCLAKWVKPKEKQKNADAENQA